MARKKIPVVKRKMPIFGEFTITSLNPEELDGVYRLRNKFQQTSKCQAVYRQMHDPFQSCTELDEAWQDFLVEELLRLEHKEFLSERKKE